jgi:hypothetical protein
VVLERAEQINIAISDLDIWRTTNVLVKQHGEDATFYAAQRADELLANADIEGPAVFKRIVLAVSELKRRRLDAGEALN